MELKHQISTFYLKGDEELYDGWERWKELIRKCPQHGYTLWQQVHMFYNGLTAYWQTNLDAAAGGQLCSLTPEEAIRVVEKMAVKRKGSPPRRSNAVSSKKDEKDEEIDRLKRKLAEAAKLNSQEPSDSTSMENCSYANQYYPNYRNHPNLSYGPQNTNIVNPEVLAPINRNAPYGNQNQNYGQGQRYQNVGQQQNYNRGNNTGPYKPPHQRQPEVPQPLQPVAPNADQNSTMEDRMTRMEKMFAEFMTSQKETNQNLQTSIRRVEAQVSRLAESMQQRDEGSLPSTSEPNPNKRCNAVIVGKEAGIEEKLAEKLEEEDDEMRRIGEEEEEIGEEKADTWGTAQDEPPETQVYTGSYNLPCVIRKQSVGDALCDLGSGINVMPFPLYQQLGLPKIEPVGIKLYLADGTAKEPLGIIRNVSVGVGNFVFTVDFVVVKIKADPDVPLILGRPFLVRAGALIDTRTGTVTLRKGSEEQSFNTGKRENDFGMDKHICSYMYTIPIP